jgi:hypothetical protein
MLTVAAYPLMPLLTELTPYGLPEGYKDFAPTELDACNLRRAPPGQKHRVKSAVPFCALCAFLDRHSLSDVCSRLFLSLPFAPAPVCVNLQLCFRFRFYSRPFVARHP